jgi:iron-sulfur cluster assembly accessory protein
VTEEFPLTLTDAAVTKIGSLLADDPHPDTALVVVVRPGGCSGFSYDMYFDAAPDESWLRTTVGDGSVAVVTDPSSAVLLRGATLSWSDGLNAGFSIDNPNSQRTCGCGKSFAG